LPWPIPLSDQEFQLFQELVKAQTGIALSEHKRSLVASRLAKRLRALGLPSFGSYYDLLTRDDTDGELEEFINAITTNKTDFYREPAHFDFLRTELIPAWKSRAARTGERRIRIWSAGCSTGEEPYTIALTLCEGLKNLLTWDIRILASDIDTKVLSQAERGIYPADRVAGVPRPILHGQFLRGVGSQAGKVQVSRAVRDLVTFRQINLLEAPWPIRVQFDCIFCRNVMIYFDRPTQQRLIERLAEALRDEGCLFLGHSESLHGITTRVTYARNTIYRKVGEGGPGRRTAEHGGGSL
jgi:chemotaxis protein methyltransferase CheR